MIAIVDAYRKGLLHRKHWMRNILAGLIVGVVALPLSMAFAIASGAEPEQGLYASIISAIFVALFGGSKVQVNGPTGAFVVILANITANLGFAGLQIASIMAGVILFVMGWSRLGSVIKFIPDPVIVGFTSGIGFIIFVGGWKDFFGLTYGLPLNAHFYKKLFALIQAFPHLSLVTTAMGGLSLLLVLMTGKLFKRIPGPLAALVIATAIQAIFQFESIATIGSAFGGLPQDIPKFSIPELDFSQFTSLIGAAFTIALLCAIASLLSAAAADGMSGDRTDPNQELIGQGLANVFAPMFGGFATSGAIARTASNVRNGGNSPIAALVHSLTLVLVIVLLAPLAANVPLCTLAAIILVVAYNMSAVPHFIRMLRKAPRADSAVMVITFFLTIFTNLVIAVNVGIVLAMLFFVRRMHQSTHMIPQTDECLKKEFSNDLPARPLGKNTLVYCIQGPLFFGVTEKFERALTMTNTTPSTLVFRMKDVPFMDITGIETFYEVVKRFHKKHVRIYICEANPKVAEKIREMDILQFVEDQKVYTSFLEIYNRKHLSQ